MKTSTIIATLVVIIAVAAAGYYVFRPTGIEAPTVSPTPQFQEIELSSESPSLGQPVMSGSEEAQPTGEDGGTTLLAPTTGFTSDNVATNVTISVDETGFHPSTVTIAAGTTVTFVNNGQANHWPASDVHPTHEILPGFDSKKGLATGETYSYTFTQVGTWPMHDHLVASNTGTITVTQ